MAKSRGDLAAWQHLLKQHGPDAIEDVSGEFAVGRFDVNGNFVDIHHLLLLLTYYMVEYKKYTGQIVVSFSATGKLKKIAELYGLGYKVTPIGFKYIADIMATEDVVVGGEESGGQSVKGHIPERDGIWMGLLVMECMAKTGKSLPQLIQDVYDKVGTFYFQRDDLHLAEELKPAKSCLVNALYNKAGGFILFIYSLTIA